MADLTLIPEPPDGAWVVVGDDPLVLLVRDEHSAREAGYVSGYHWFAGHDSMVAPLSWAQVTGAELDDGRLLADKSVIQRVYTQAEVESRVAEARSVRLGRHVREPGGYCSTCGHDHHETEWARIRSQVEEEARGDD